MKTIALISPLLTQKFLGIEFRNRENLSIGYLASYLESKGYNVKTINALLNNWETEDIIKSLRTEEYLFIGISCNSQNQYPSAKELIQSKGVAG